MLWLSMSMWYLKLKKISWIQFVCISVQPGREPLVFREWLLYGLHYLNFIYFFETHVVSSSTRQLFRECLEMIFVVILLWIINMDWDWFILFIKYKDINDHHFQPTSFLFNITGVTPTFENDGQQASFKWIYTLFWINACCSPESK